MARNQGECIKTYLILDIDTLGIVTFDQVWL